MAKTRNDYISEQIKNIAQGYGNYIHLHANNYKLYGIGYRTKGKDLHASIQETKSQLKTEANKSHSYTPEQIEHIQNLLQNFVYMDWKNIENGVQVGDVKLTQDEILHIQEEMAEIAGETSKDVITLIQQPSASGKVMNKKNLKDTYRYNMDKRNETRKINSATLKKLNQQIEKVMGNIKAAGKKGEIGPTDKTVLLNQGAELQKSLNDIVSRLPKRKGEHIGRLNIWDKNNKQQAEAWRQLIEDINTYIYATEELSKRYGDSFESVGFGIYRAGNYTTEKATEEIIKEILPGGNRTAKTVMQFGKTNDTDSMIQAKYFIDATKSFNKQTNQWYSPFKYEDNGQVVYQSQETVDWSMDTELSAETRAKFNLPEFNASLKSYSSLESSFNDKHEGIGIINGVPLLSVLNLATTDFVNHYLNLLAANGEVEMPTEVEDIVKIATAVRALTGARGQLSTEFKRNDLFIVNERKGRKNGKIHVLPVNMMISNLFKDINNLNKYLKIDNLPTTLKNEKVDAKGQNIMVAIKRRITKVLAETHKAKLNASLLKPAIIKQ